MAASEGPRSSLDLDGLSGFDVFDDCRKQLDQGTDPKVVTDLAGYREFVGDRISAAFRTFGTPTTNDYYVHVGFRCVSQD